MRVRRVRVTVSLSRSDRLSLAQRFGVDSFLGPNEKRVWGRVEWVGQLPPLSFGMSIFWFEY